MDTSLPPLVPIMMVLSTVLTIFCFYKASKNIIVVYWICILAAIQGLLALGGFYTDFESMPPHFPLLILPSLVSIVLLYAFPRSRYFLDHVDQSWLTFLHIVRFPVELILYWLYMFYLVPEVMTFDGRNFDVISGITAPFIAYWGFVIRKMDYKWVLAWNVICVLLLLNIVITAILSAPTPIQKMALDQPNIGVFIFPYVWLPSIIVPVVLLSHIISIRQLLRVLSAHH